MNIYNLKKDRLALLEEVESFVDIWLKNVDVNINSKSDVSDFFRILQDKKKVKTMKIISKELKKWIAEMENDRT